MKNIRKIILRDLFTKESEHMERLRDLRKEKGLSQLELSLNLGMPQSTYQQYEAGINEASYDVLGQLADYFSVSIDYLLGRTDIRVPVIDIDLQIALRIRQLENSEFSEAALTMLNQIEKMINRDFK